MTNALTGKKLILEPQPHEKGNVRVGGDRGFVLSKLDQAKERGFGTPLYRSHYASCPQAKEWRRKS